jgi:hypothetical protein
MRTVRFRRRDAPTWRGCKVIGEERSGPFHRAMGLQCIADDLGCGGGGGGCVERRYVYVCV